MVKTKGLLHTDMSLEGTGTETVDDLVVSVGFTYDPGDPGVHTYPNGDPGYPGTPSEVSIEEIWIGEHDLFAVLSEDVIDKMEEKLLEEMGKSLDENPEED